MAAALSRKIVCRVGLLLVVSKCVLADVDLQNAEYESDDICQLQTTATHSSLSEMIGVGSVLKRAAAVADRAAAGAAAGGATGGNWAAASATGAATASSGAASGAMASGGGANAGATGGGNWAAGGGANAVATGGGNWAAVGGANAGATGGGNWAAASAATGGAATSGASPAGGWNGAAGMTAAPGSGADQTTKAPSSIAAMPIAPFGKEDTSRELQSHAARTQDTLVDALENAEVAEIKRSVFRSLTRLRAAEIKEFDTIARLETQAIDEYNDNHVYRKENPIDYLSANEQRVSEDKYTSFHD